MNSKNNNNNNNNNNSNNNNNHKPAITIPQTRPEPKPEPEPISTALVTLSEYYYSPLSSPLPSPPPPPPQHVIQFSQHEELPPHSAIVHDDGVRNGKGVISGKKDKKKKDWKSVGLGIRVLEIILCLISLSVMISDNTQGWAGDSFYRYKEFRYCLTVAIFGFVYSMFQACDLGSYMATGKHVISHCFRGQFDFIMDQILAYLLISASSAAASRVDNWQANWGKDEFTKKASASISMAFLAFFCFSMSSLISGYNLCNRDSY